MRTDFSEIIFIQGAYTCISSESCNLYLSFFIYVLFFFAFRLYRQSLYMYRSATIAPPPNQDLEVNSFQRVNLHDAICKM